MKRPDPTKQKTRPDLDETTWLAWISMQPENRGIEVRDLYRKMLEWCDRKGLTPTRLRLLNWIAREREAIPLDRNAAILPFPAAIEASPDLPDCDACKNERFVQGIINPDAPYDWARTGMVPCPDCNKEKDAD